MLPRASHAPKAAVSAGVRLAADRPRGHNALKDLRDRGALAHPGEVVGHVVVLRPVVGGSQVAHASPELQLRLDDDGIEERMPCLPAHDALQDTGGVAAEPQLAFGICDDKGGVGAGELVLRCAPLVGSEVCVSWCCGACVLL